MKARQTRTILWTLSMLFMLGTILVLLSGVLWPAGVIPLSVPKPKILTSQTKSSVPASLAEYAPLWNLDLRKPLFDPPPVVVTAPPAVKPPPLTVKLAGTIIEPGHSVGMFQLPDGQVELKGVGEETGGAEILNIEEGRVTVRYHGESIQLLVEKKEG